MIGLIALGSICRTITLMFEATIACQDNINDKVFLDTSCSIKQGNTPILAQP